MLYRFGNPYDALPLTWESILIWRPPDRGLRNGTADGSCIPTVEGQTIVNIASIAWLIISMCSLVIA